MARADKQEMLLRFPDTTCETFAIVIVDAAGPSAADGWQLREITIAMCPSQTVRRMMKQDMFGEKTFAVSHSKLCDNVALSPRQHLVIILGSESGAPSEIPSKEAARQQVRLGLGLFIVLGSSLCVQLSLDGCLGCAVRERDIFSGNIP